MDWAAAERRDRPDTVEGRIFADLWRLIDVRRGVPQFHAATPLDIIDSGDPGVLAFIRRHPTGALTAIYNFTEGHRSVAATIASGTTSGLLVDLLDGSNVRVDRPIEVPPLGVRWLVPAEAPS
jgi:amylosucrase